MLDVSNGTGLIALTAVRLGASDVGGRHLRARRPLHRVAARSDPVSVGRRSRTASWACWPETGKRTRGQDVLLMSVRAWPGPRAGANAVRGDAAAAYGPTRD